MSKRNIVIGLVVAGLLVLIGMWWASRARAGRRELPTGEGGGSPTGSGTGTRVNPIRRGVSQPRVDRSDANITATQERLGINTTIFSDTALGGL